MAEQTLQPGDIIPQAQSFENFKLTLFGRSIIQFSEFSLEYSAESAMNYGKNGEPVSWLIKQYKREAKATLHMDELKFLIQQAVAFGGDLLKLPPQPVTAESKSESGILKLVIPAAKIVKFPINFKDGDDKMEVPLDFLVASYPIITWS